MNCRKHAYSSIPDETVDNGSYVETRTYAGVACTNCGMIRANRKTCTHIRIQNRNPTQGEIPSWLRERLQEGKATLRAPESTKRYDEVSNLARNGTVNALLSFNQAKGEWAAVEIEAPHIHVEDPIPALRLKLTQRLPDSAEWIARATLADLRTAEAILEIPSWNQRNWLPRIWTSLIRNDSKRGDAAAIARRLGARVPERSTNSQWFYGQGTLHFDDAPPREVEHEECIPDRRLKHITRIGASKLDVIENRDLAWHHQDGLTFCLDGNPTPAQLEFLARVGPQITPRVLWTDADAEGIRIIRTIRKILPIDVHHVGPHHPEWGIPLDAEKQRILLQELHAPEDEWTPTLASYHAALRFWEQERIFAELQISGECPSKNGLPRD